MADDTDNAVTNRGKAVGSAMEGLESANAPVTNLTSFKRGGKVKRTGPAELHKGERVLNRKQAKKYGRKRGGRK